MKVIMYSQTAWRRCQAARAWLARLKIPHEVRDIYGTPGAAEEIREWQVTMLPAFVVGQSLIIGWQPEAILRAIANFQENE